MKLLQFCYVGSIITKGSVNTAEFKKRIGLSRISEKEGVLTNKYVNIETNKAFAKTFIWSILSIFENSKLFIRKQIILKL